jgi:hypothetical protein
VTTTHILKDCEPGLVYLPGPAARLAVGALRDGIDPASVVASSRVTGTPSENHRICSQRPQKVKVNGDEPVSMSMRRSRVPQQTCEIGLSTTALILWPTDSTTRTGT